MAMEDWLATFGTFQLNLPAGIGAGNYFLPVNSKSLVVSHFNPSSLGALRPMIWVFTLLVRYPFSPLELSLARFPRSLWETWLAVNGGLSHHAWFSVLALACNSIPIGQPLSWGELSPELVWYVGQFVVPCAILWPPSFLGSRLMFSPHVSIRGIKNDVTFYMYLTFDYHNLIVRP